MIARVLIVGAAALVSTSVNGAQPTEPTRNVQSGQASAPRLLLASADEVRLPTQADPQAPAPAKRPRIARVTTCRCGDTSAPDQHQQ